MLYLEHAIALFFPKKCLAGRLSDLPTLAVRIFALSSSLFWSHIHLFGRLADDADESRSSRVGTCYRSTPVFADIVEKTRDGSNASSEPRRQVFYTTDAELALVWRGKTVRSSSTSSCLTSTSSHSSNKGAQRTLRGQKSKRHQSSVTFAKDIVFLRSHTDRTVPTSSKRAELYRQGFILNLCEIQTAGTKTELIEKIKDAFIEKFQYEYVG